MSEEKVDPFDRILKMIKKGDIYLQGTQFSDQLMIDSAREYNWEGSGSEHDPIIIDSFEGFGPRITILKSRLFVLFKDCEFNFLSIHTCEHITFENCKISSLSLFKSERVSFFDCNISLLHLNSSNNNYFKRSSFKRVEISNIHDNIFEDCIASKRNLKRLAKERDYYL